MPEKQAVAPIRRTAARIPADGAAGCAYFRAIARTQDPPMTPPSPGHNTPPEMEPGYRWRLHCWRVAQQALARKPVSATTLRLRSARAAELGLSYRQYAGLHAVSGRDPRALIFSPEALHLRLARRLSLPDPVRDKLAGLRNCHLLALAPPGEAPGAFLDELRAVTALPFAGAAASPPPGAGWGAIRAALRPALAPLALPGDAAVLIGRTEGAGGAAAPEPGWAAALRAPFLAADSYFGT
jgi:hypothetical protein